MVVRVVVVSCGTAKLQVNDSGRLGRAARAKYGYRSGHLAQLPMSALLQPYY
jgi:hypothetical protein